MTEQNKINNSAIFMSFFIALLIVFTPNIVRQAFLIYKNEQKNQESINKAISGLKKITDSTNISTKDFNIETLRNNFELVDITLKKMEKESNDGVTVNFNEISAIAESRGVYRARLQLSCQQFIEEKSIVLKVSPNNESLKYCLENWDFPTAYKLP